MKHRRTVTKLSGKSHPILLTRVKAFRTVRKTASPGSRPRQTEFMSKQGSTKQIVINACRPNTAFAGTVSKEIFRETFSRGSVTQGESHKIREKLALYETCLKSTYHTYLITLLRLNRKNEHLDEVVVTGRELGEKFQKLSTRINSLLAQEAPVMDLRPGKEAQTTILSGRRCHFRMPKAIV